MTIIVAVVAAYLFGLAVGWWLGSMPVKWPELLSREHTEEK